MNFNIDKKAFIKNGYCVVKNLLNESEVQYYDDKIKKLAKGKHFNLGGIYNAKEISDIVVNKKLLASKSLLVLKYFFYMTQQSCIKQNQNILKIGIEIILAEDLVLVQIGINQCLMMY